MDIHQLSQSTGFLFGSFELVPSRRLLTNAGQLVKVGSRALDLLIALVERGGQVVTKQELMSQVWADIVVEDTNLRVHVSALRRALGDDGNSSRYIVHVARRGYVFVAPLLLRATGLLQSETARASALPEAMLKYTGRIDKPSLSLKECAYDVHATAVAS